MIWPIQAPIVAKEASITFNVKRFINSSWVVGSIASSIIWEIGKGILNDSEQKIIQYYQENLNNYIKILDKHYLAIYNER